MAGSYAVEQRSGGTGAPWLPAGTWMLAAPTLSLDVSFSPMPTTLSGTWARTSGGKQRVTALGSLRPPYDFTVFVQGQEVGTWNFADQRILSVDITSADGRAFEGTARLRPEEGELDVRGRLLP
jgi:hypothetical protein